MTQNLKIALVSQPYDGIRPPHQNSVGISVYERFRKLAQFHEVTVVAARVGGMVESVVYKQTGILIEPASGEELASAVSRLLTDNELREKMAVAARRHIVENFSWQSIAENLEHEYRETFTDNG